MKTSTLALIALALLSTACPGPLPTPKDALNERLELVEAERLACVAACVTDEQCGRCTDVALTRIEGEAEQVFQTFYPVANGGGAR
jgi:hypothetical protein